MNTILLASRQRSGAVLGVLSAIAFGCVMSDSASAQTFTSANGDAFVVSNRIVTINQSASSNAVAVVQQEQTSDSATTQTGIYNRTVIFQRGSNPATFNDKFANVTQAGSFNRALVVQIGTTAADLQSARTVQTGTAANNFNLTIQTSATAGSNSDIANKLGALSLNDAKLFASNFLSGPETARVNVGVLQDATLHFSSILENQLDQTRDGGCTADKACSTGPLFIVFNYGKTSRENDLGVLGYEQDIRSGTIGVNLISGPSGRFGIAANYADTHSNLNAGLGGIDTKGYQFGAYGSISGPRYYVDLIASIGKFNLSAKRFDGTSQVSAKTNGWSYSARLQAGYRLGQGEVHYGPVIGLAYNHNSVDGYSESGNILFTQVIGQQKNKALFGSIGAMVEFGSASSLRGYLKAEAEHDFGADGTALIKTNFSFAPTLAVYTPLNSKVKETYGKITGSISYPIGERVNLSLSGRAIVGSSRLDSFNIFAGLRIRL
jgi:uncharacterized protein YhjY with autotransporter beta-barrel domain